MVTVRRVVTQFVLEYLLEWSLRDLHCFTGGALKFLQIFIVIFIPEFLFETIPNFFRKFSQIFFEDFSLRFIWKFCQILSRDLIHVFSRKCSPNSSFWRSFSAILLNAQPSASIYQLKKFLSEFLLYMLGMCQKFSWGFPRSFSQRCIRDLFQSSSRDYCSS